MVAKYPEFAKEEHVAKLRCRGLKRLLDQAWDEGQAEGVKKGVTLEKLRALGSKVDSIFGKGFPGR